jgi:hypothetical protein
VHVFLSQRRWRPRLRQGSLLHFTAPADGEYIVKLHDMRGVAGADMPTA